MQLSGKENLDRFPETSQRLGHDWAPAANANGRASGGRLYLNADILRIMRAIGGGDRSPTGGNPNTPSSGGGCH